MRGKGIGGCGADLSCCAWQEASQTQQAEKGAGIRKHVNHLKFNSHGSCQGPGGRFCLCLLFHYFLSLGPVASGWSPVKLPPIGFIHPSIHPSIHQFSKIFSKLRILRDTATYPEFVCKWENDDFIDSTFLDRL